MVRHSQRTGLLLLASVAGLASAQFEEMFSQMFGDSAQFEVNGGGGGGEAVPQDVSEEFAWLKGTEWNWNDWRNVEFAADGRFKAPTPDCEAGQCRWSADEDTVFVQWGQSGLHKLRPNQMEAATGTVLDGVRVQDGDGCQAKFVKKTNAQIAADEADDLYAALGLDEEATPKQIKKAYRKLSLKYHPDKNPGDAEAQRKFNLVRDAYEVLSNEDKKILFDTGGMEAVKEHAKQVQQEEQGGGQQDPFSAFFGGGQQQQGRQGGNKGQDFQANLEATLEQLYNGAEVPTSISRRVVCRGCKGKKGKGKPHCKECKRCPNEVKTVQRQVGPGFMVNQQVEVKSKEKCKEQSVTLKATIERGHDDGAQIAFPRMSEQKPGQIPGDVIFVIKTKDHARYTRRGNDLHMGIELSLKEALLGFSKSFQHLDGHEFTVEAQGVTRPFQVIRLRNEGMPLHGTPSELGSMHVKCTVKMPKKLTAQQRELIEKHM
jgi:DnaJ-class molecular chaperone